MGATPPVIALESVSLARPGFTLGPASLRLEATTPGSSLTVLVGPSGSGKSTLLALAAGLLPPTAGIVRHAGLDLRTLGDVTRAATRRRIVAFAAQQPLFFAEQSVLGNLAETARRRLGPTSGRLPALDGEKEARAALASVGLDHLADRPPSYLSGGEQARANVARALCGKAATILLDEPTAMLDAATASTIRALLVARSAQCPLLIATHDEELIAKASVVLRLENGQVIA